jgi:KDO2-lipid IV(A) lauroyltransferase
VLLLTAHLGNWEVMGARAAQDFPLTVVARPSSNSGIQRHIAEVRRAAGIDVISKFDTGRTSLQVLRANGALGILPDQYAWPDGPLMPMFGHLTRFITSPARLALLAHAPIVPGFGVRRTPWLADGRIMASVWPAFYVTPACRHASREAAVHEATRCVIAQIEAIVRRHPDQWLWMHRRWRAEDMTTPGGIR